MEAVDLPTAVYQVQSGDTRSEFFEFRTLPDAGEPLRIGWFADNQLGPDQLTTRLDLMRPEDPDLLVAVGDIVQEGWRHLDEARTDWQPVFEAHQVDLVIYGLRLSGSRSPSLRSHNR